jgi:hypothetical protein
MGHGENKDQRRAKLKKRGVPGNRPGGIHPHRRSVIRFMWTRVENPDHDTCNSE